MITYKDLEEAFASVGLEFDDAFNKSQAANDKALFDRIISGKTTLEQEEAAFLKLWQNASNEA